MRTVTKVDHFPYKRTRINVTDAQYDVLRLIAEAGEDGISTLAIAVRLGISRPAVLGRIRQLNAKDLVGCWETTWNNACLWVVPLPIEELS